MDPTSPQAASSALYPKYPSEDSRFVSLGGANDEETWDGFWEDLQAYVGILFDRSKYCSLIVSQTGIFKWNEQTMNMIKPATQLGNTTKTGNLRWWRTSWNWHTMI
jgi:hypothetical protein